MAEYIQRPGNLPLTLTQGDQVDIGLQFTGRTLTGYTMSSAIYVTNTYATDGGGAGFVTAAGATAATFTIGVVDLTQGQVNLNLQEEQTARLSPAVGYRWYFSWVDPNGIVGRKVLSGPVTVVTD